MLLNCIYKKNKITNKQAKQPSIKQQLTKNKKS